MIKWIKHKLGIIDLERRVYSLESRFRHLKEQTTLNRTNIVKLQEDFKLNNRLSGDISMKDSSYIIVSGKWRGKDYVEIYPIYIDETESLVRELKNRFGNREFKMDSPINLKGLW